MRIGLEALYRRPNTSKPAPGHNIYPYLLRKLAVRVTTPVHGDRPYQQVRPLDRLGTGFVELHEKAGKMIAARFLHDLVSAVPYKIHTVLTDNPVSSEVERGIRFTNHAYHKYAFHHIFDRVCDENGIEHRLAKVKHPWTNGQSLPRRRPGSNG